MTLLRITQALACFLSVLALCATTHANADDHQLIIRSELASAEIAGLDLTHIDSHQIDQITAQALVATSGNKLALARRLLSDLVEHYPAYHLG